MVEIERFAQQTVYAKPAVVASLASQACWQVREPIVQKFASSRAVAEGQAEVTVRQPVGVVVVDTWACGVVTWGSCSAGDVGAVASSRPWDCVAAGKACASAEAGAGRNVVIGNGEGVAATVAAEGADSIGPDGSCSRRDALAVHDSSSAFAAGGDAGADAWA